MHHIEIFRKSGMPCFGLTKGTPESDIISQDIQDHRFVVSIPDNLVKLFYLFNFNTHNF